MKYSNLSIRTIVMHEIVNKSLNGPAPIISTVAAQMDEEQRLFIQERMRTTLAESARPIAEDDSDPKLPILVRGYLSQDVDLIELSKTLANLLQSAQPMGSPAGLFLACECEMEYSKALLIAKLEHQRGVRAPHTRLADGSVTFAMETLHDLLFTNKSKIYKVALFSHAQVENNLLRGEVVDKQMAGHSIARYFMSQFLGCQLAERADLHTQKFYETAQGFINTIEDAEKKGRYEVSLLSEMQRNSSTLSVDKFANDYMEEDDRDDFSARMQERSVPLREFDKDTALVKGQLLRVKLDTNLGVTVLAPPSVIENGTVSISKNDDDTSTVTVRDKISKFSGSGMIKRIDLEGVASVDG